MEENSNAFLLDNMIKMDNQMEQAEQFYVQVKYMKDKFNLTQYILVLVDLLDQTVVIWDGGKIVNLKEMELQGMNLEQLKNMGCL